MRHCCLHAPNIFVSDECEILDTLELGKEEYENLLSGSVSDRIRDFLSPYFPLTFENKLMAENLGGEFQFPNPAGEMARSKRGEEGIYEAALEHSRKAVTKASEKKDKHIVQAINAIGEIDETINLFSERLREWYSLHYPELSRQTKDNARYARLVMEHGSRKNFPEKPLSMGAELDEKDEAQLRLFAETIDGLQKKRETLEEYVNDQTKRIAPNLTHLLGGNIVAKLLSSAGGLEELARKPSSTVQLLGAEKALFRHLKTGSDPPKHGILFQYPPINSAPYWQRGKIARMVASKVSILARVDFFGSEFLADRIEEHVKRRIGEIRQKYPEQPKKEAKIFKRKKKIKRGR